MRDPKDVERAMEHYWQQKDYPVHDCGMDHYSDPDHCTTHCEEVTKWFEQKLKSSSDRIARLEAALDAAYDLEEFNKCIEAQRKDMPYHDDDESCGDGVCFKVGELIDRVLKSLPDQAATPGDE